MSAPAYSTRFLQGVGVTTLTWTVPTGKRAVIRDVSSANATAITGNVAVRVNTSWIYLHRYQVSEASMTRSLMVVAYAGEVLTLFIGGAEITATVSGFLFNDPPVGAGLAAAAPAWDPDEFPEIVDVLGSG